jgi:type IV fimbrial biogenesis protein FimT
MDTLQLRKARRHHAGLTLVEALITLAVSALALGTAAPGFDQLRERRQVEGAAAQLETDIQHARSLAAAQSRPVRMSFEAAADASCYVVHTGSAGDCRCSANGEAVCRGSAQALQTVRWDAGTALRVVSNSPSILFDATRGTATPTATIKVQGRHVAIHQVVNLMGRVRSCTPAAPLPGYRAC